MCKDEREEFYKKIDIKKLNFGGTNIYAWNNKKFKL